MQDDYLKEVKSILKGLSIKAQNPKPKSKKDLSFVQALQRGHKIKPFKDYDGDGVMNILDCKPYDFDRQDFTPFKKKGRGKREEDDMTAAERFGGANIKKLKKVGEGRDRIVYQLDKDKVLKIAKNVGGLRQNRPERDLGGYLNYIKHHETGKDYVVMEKVQKPTTKKVKEFLTKLKKAPIKTQRLVYNYKRKGLSDEQRDVLEEHGHGDLLNYDTSPGDVRRKSSWGEKDGEAVLVDGGVLIGDSLSEPHTRKKMQEKYDERVRVFGTDNNKAKIMKQEMDEWDEVARERQKFKSKGQKRVYSDPESDRTGEGKKMRWPYEEPSTIQSLDKDEENEPKSEQEQQEQQEEKFNKVKEILENTKEPEKEPEEENEEETEEVDENEEEKVE